MRLKENHSSKFQKINKCPVCGAILDSVSGICPDCKYEGSGLNANNIVEDFAKLIKQAESPLSRTTVVKAIENFPIPSARQDLLEILAFICPKINPITVGGRKKDLKAIEISRAYFHKFEECIMKAKTFYSNDPDFSTFYTEYRRYRPTKPKRNWFTFALKWIVIIALAAFVYIIISFL